MKRLAISAIFIIAMLLPVPIYALNLSTAYISDSIPIPNIEPEGMTWDGTHLWITDIANNTFVQFSPTTRSEVRSIPAVASAEGLAWDGSYLWTYSLNDLNLYKVNPATGGTSYRVLVGQMGRGGLTYDGAYFWKVDRPEIRKIDSSDGNVIDTIPALGIPSIMEGLTYDGTFLYNIAYDGPSNAHIYKIDPVVHTVLEDFHLPEGTYNGLAFDGSSLWAASYSNRILYEISSTPVPEPSTMLLLSTGLIGLAAYRRKFRKNFIFFSKDHAELRLRFFMPTRNVNYIL